MLILFWAQNNSTYRFVPDTTAAKVIGVVITFLGLGFAVWARVHLGKYWSGNVTIKVEHKLIRTGPYKWVRNPIYTGIIIAVVGSVIADGQILALLSIVCIVIGFLIKIRMEEKFLLEEFGEAFIQYKKEVKSLIPFVY
jgi:protein-S-isoprenylcysteine O-methyltransferase Ste14